MAEQNNNHKEKTITLSKLKPQEYRLWAMTARATLGVYGVLDVVEGNEPDPTPRNPDGTVRTINPQVRARIEKWNRNHELAREALTRPGLRGFADCKLRRGRCRSRRSVRG